MAEPFRLIIDDPMPAVFNMAADEYLMESQQSADAMGVLRFYRWSLPSVSIGYFQSVDSAAHLYDAKKKKITVIRRISGGGIVVHGQDLTFSLTLKNPSTFFPKDIKESYFKVHEVLRHTLQPLYPDLDYAKCTDAPSPRGKGARVCFEQPTCHDLMLNGKKVVGASQRRKNGVLLHQSALFFKEDPEGLVVRLADGFCREWGLDLKVQNWSEEERRRIKTVAERRYELPEWIYPLADASTKSV